MVPVVMVNLHEADATLDKPTGEQTGKSEGARLFGLVAVELVGAGGLVLHVGQLRDAGLHAVSHLELLDARVCLGVADAVVVELVERLEAVELAAAKGIGHAPWILDEKNRIALAAEGHAGMFAGKEPDRRK